MRTLAHWSFSHRRRVLLVWAIVVVGLSVVHGVVGSDYRDSFNLNGTESAQAIDLLKASAPKTAGDSDQIVVAARDGKVTGAAVRQKVSAMLAAVAKLPHVGSVDSPYAAAGARQIAKSGRIAYATVTFDEEAPSLPKGAITKVIDTAKTARSAQVDVELGGQAIQTANRQPPGGVGEGILAAGVVLLLVFGSLLAAALPLITAGFALGTGIAVIGLLSNAVTMASFSSNLALLIGLGVGVDYALFIVTRYRQALLRGLSSEEAVAQSLDTSGRAVLFAGVTVCIALLGMFALGISFLYGVAIAATIIVAFTVLTALTLLPALLGFFGKKTLTKRQRRTLAGGELALDDESSRWASWARTLQARPLVAVAAATLVMLTLAVPFLSLRLGSSDAGSDPSSTTTRKAYDLLADGFGAGFNGPLQLVAKVDQPGQEAQFKQVLASVAKTPDVVSTSPARVVGGVAVAQVISRGSPQDASTTDLVKTLRTSVVPAAADGRVEVKVGGQTAIFQDFAGAISNKLPLFIGIVVLLSFLLLMAVFRSLVIPAMAAVMNLLSVAAAFGVVTAVFQHGWGASLIGVDRTGPIEAFVPVMVFAILFGLSMDYEVFLMSRIYEEWHKRKDNREAVVHGLAATGRTITAAAAIMVLVFGAFLLGGERVIKLFGLGLASAVLFDAVIVRSVLVPGLLLVIGKANWWLPDWLERRLPHLSVEGSDAVAASPPARAAGGALRPATERV